jgi:hypothetical protein
MGSGSSGMCTAWRAIRPIGRNAASFLIWTLTDLLWKVFAPGRKDNA